MPVLVNPHGTEIVGKPKMSNGCVLRSEYVTPPGGGTSDFALSAMLAGETGVVGVTRTSTLLKTSRITRRRRSSSRLPAIYASAVIFAPPLIRSRVEG